MILTIVVAGLLLSACGGDLTPEERIRKMRRLVEEEQFPEARDELQRLMVDHPTDPAVLLLGGRIHIGLEQLDSALTYAKKYAALYSRDAEGLRMLSQVAEQLGDYQTQLEAIDRLSYLENNRRGYLPQIADLNMKIDKPGMTVVICRDILEYDPDNQTVLFMLASGLAATGKVDSAITVMEVLEVRFPDQAEVLANLGSYLASAERYREAEIRFLRLTSLYPEFPGGWYGLGNIQAQRGDTTGARDAYMHVYEMDPTFLGVDTLLENLGVPREEGGASD